MPDPLFVGDLLHRLDGDINVEKMPDPCFEHAAERVQAGRGEVERQHGVVVLRPAPVELRILLAQHVELDAAQRRARFGHELAERAEAAGGGVHLHRLGVGCQDGALL